MIPMPQVPTAVGRPPVATGVSAPNRAAAPRLAAPSVAGAPVGRPRTAGGPRPGAGVQPRTLASKFPAASAVSPQLAQGAVGGWNAAPDLVANATKMLKAGAELGPQHRGPLESLLKNTDRPQIGPYGGGAPALAEAYGSGGGFSPAPGGGNAMQAGAARSFASRFRGPEVA